MVLVAGSVDAEPRRLSPVDLQSLGVRVESSVEAVVAARPLPAAPPALKPVRKPAAVQVRPRPKPAALVPAPPPLPLLPMARPAQIVSGPLPLDAGRLQAVALKPAGPELASPGAESEEAVAPVASPPVSVPTEVPQKLDADGLFAVGLGARGRASDASP